MVRIKDVDELVIVVWDAERLEHLRRTGKSLPEQPPISVRQVLRMVDHLVRERIFEAFEREQLHRRGKTGPKPKRKKNGTLRLGRELREIREAKEERESDEIEGTKFEL